MITLLKKEDLMNLETVYNDIMIEAINHYLNKRGLYYKVDNEIYLPSSFLGKFIRLHTAHFGTKFKNSIKKLLGQGVDVIEIETPKEKFLIENSKEVGYQDSNLIKDVQNKGFKQSASCVITKRGCYWKKEGRFQDIFDNSTSEIVASLHYFKDCFDGKVGFIEYINEPFGSPKHGTTQLMILFIMDTKKNFINT